MMLVAMMAITMMVVNSNNMYLVSIQSALYTYSVFNYVFWIFFYSTCMRSLAVCLSYDNEQLCAHLFQTFSSRNSRSYSSIIIDHLRAYMCYITDCF